MKEHLIAIECVVLLFWNYTSEDIDYLRAKSRDFDYVWKTYVEHCDEKEYPNTYMLLWELWMQKFSFETKALLIEYATARFSDQKRRQLGLSEQVRQAFAKEMEDEKNI